MGFVPLRGPPWFRGARPCLAGAIPEHRDPSPKRRTEGPKGGPAVDARASAAKSGGSPGSLPTLLARTRGRRESVRITCREVPGRSALVPGPIRRRSDEPVGGEPRGAASPTSMRFLTSKITPRSNPSVGPGQSQVPHSPYAPPVPTPQHARTPTFGDTNGKLTAWPAWPGGARAGPRPADETSRDPTPSGSAWWKNWGSLRDRDCTCHERSPEFVKNP